MSDGDFDSREGTIVFTLKKNAFKGDEVKELISLDDEEGYVELTLEDRVLKLVFSNEEVEKKTISYNLEAEGDFHIGIMWNIDQSITLYVDGDPVESDEF